MMMHIRGASLPDLRTASKGLDDALDRSLADCFSLPPDALPVDEQIPQATAYDTDTVPTTNNAHAHRANDTLVDDSAVEDAIGDVVSLPSVQYAKKRAFPSPIWGTMLGSGIAAVVTGGLFGSALLSLAAETAPPPPVVRSSSPIGAVVPVSVPVMVEEHTQETTTLTAPQNASPKMTTGGQSPSLYVIQYGVFRQQSGARERMWQLHARGVAAVMSATSPYRVYGAVIPDRDQAIAFGHMLRQVDAEVLVKGWEWPLAAAVQRVVALPRSDIPDFITQNRHVMQWYSTQSSARLLSKEVERTVEMRVPSFVQARVVLAQKSSALLPQATAPRRNPVHAKMDDCFSLASEAWDAYTKRPLRRYLWDIQQQMLRYVALEHTFFMQEAVSVSHSAPFQSTPHTDHTRTR